VGELKEVEILLVEDNPNDMELTLRAMSRCNLEVAGFVWTT